MLIFKIKLREKIFLLCAHVLGDFFYILGLSGQRNFGDAWKVDESQVRTKTRANCEFDGLVDDVFVGSCEFVRDFVNHLLNNREIHVFLVFQLVKLRNRLLKFRFFH